MGRAYLLGIGVAGSSARRTGFIVYGVVLGMVSPQVRGVWQTMQRTLAVEIARKGTIRKLYCLTTTMAPCFFMPLDLKSWRGRGIFKSRLWRGSVRQRI